MRPVFQHSHADSSGVALHSTSFATGPKLAPYSFGEHICQHDLGAHVLGGHVLGAHANVAEFRLPPRQTLACEVVDHLIVLRYHEKDRVLQQLQCALIVRHYRE